MSGIGDFWEDAKEDISQQWESFKGDPARIAFAIGTAGASELAYYIGDRAGEAARNEMDKMEESPEMEKPGTAPTMNSASVRAAAAAQASRSRGRASTLLSGQGRSLGTGGMARRTLLGD